MAHGPAVAGAPALPNLGPSGVRQYASGRRGTTVHPTCTHTSTPFVHSHESWNVLEAQLSYSYGTNRLEYRSAPRPT